MDRVFTNAAGQQYVAEAPSSTADSENVNPSSDLIGILKSAGSPQKVSEVQEVFTRFLTLEESVKETMRHPPVKAQLELPVVKP